MFAMQAEVKGSSSIEIAGADVAGSVYAGGFALDDSSSSTIEKSAQVKISSGSIGGDIYAGGFGKQTSVKGDSSVVFVGNSQDISFAGTVYGGGQNGGTVEGKLSGIDTVEVSGASDVEFTNAFSVDKLLVGATSKVSLVADSTFNSISIKFESEKFESGDELAFSLDDIFSDSSVVEKALESGSSLTVLDSAGAEWNADYQGGNIQIGSAVPEPAAYAAIFGVLGLAFALCRKRR